MTFRTGALEETRDDKAEPAAGLALPPSLASSSAAESNARTDGAGQRSVSPRPETRSLESDGRRWTTYPWICGHCGVTFWQRKKGKGSPNLYCSKICSVRATGAQRTAAAKPYVDAFGYVRLWRKGICLRLHRVVMEELLGRALLASETVHHINGDRTDNRPENLQLRTGRHGKGQVYQCLDCGSAHIGPIPIAELGRSTPQRVRGRAQMKGA